MEHPVRPPHGVVPVAADREPDTAGVVAAREVEPLDRRQCVGQQAALQSDRDVVLSLLAARPVERSGRMLRMGKEQRLLGGLERPVIGEQKRHRAGRATCLGPEGQPVERVGRRLQLRDRLAEHRRELGSGERDVIGRLVRERCDRNDGRVVSSQAGRHLRARTPRLSGRSGHPRARQRSPGRAGMPSTERPRGRPRPHRLRRHLRATGRARPSCRI